MTGSQLERAVGAAKVQSDIGESAAAFTNVLESEGLEEAQWHLGSDRAAPAVHPSCAVHAVGCLVLSAGTKTAPQAALPVREPKSGTHRLGRTTRPRGRVASAHRRGVTGQRGPADVA